jgi:exodeoxyribonuclease V alpha subunit
MHSPEFEALSAPFLDQGVLGAAAVHGVDLLAHRDGVTDAGVLLGLAFALQSPETGSVGVDLGRVRELTFVERVLDDAALARRMEMLPWPGNAADWAALVATCDVLVGGPSMEDSRPFVQDGALVMPRRYWRYQEQLARDLEARAGVEPAGMDLGTAREVREVLDRLLGRPHVAGEMDRQRLAALTAVLSRLTVVTGGPGTGKTHTVAVLLLAFRAYHRAVHGRDPKVALAAPTGKAAVRMAESVGGVKVDPGVGQGPTAEEVTWLKGLTCQTLHRLLGSNPSRVEMFSRGPKSPLEEDLVVVDECSMVDLSLMCRLAGAVRPDGCLVLVGDPGQLASVEAGSVLSDVMERVDPTSLARSPGVARALRAADPDGMHGICTEDRGTCLQDGLVALTKLYRTRKDSCLQEMALAIARDNRERACGFLLDGRAPDVRLVDHASPTELHPQEFSRVCDDATMPWAMLSRDGDATRRHVDALARMSDFRILTPHRAGPFGVANLNRLVVEHLRGQARGSGARVRVGGVEENWPGRPVLVTQNSPDQGLVNGDTGLVVAAPDGTLRVAFARPGGGVPRYVDPARMPPHETCFAMTVHKSQGSQFGKVVLVLPARRTPLVTRELVYTGLTRAARELVVLGSAEVFRQALGARTRRASTLGQRLRGARDPA